MITYQAAPFIDSSLTENGLNLHHVFDLKDLPDTVLTPITELVGDDHEFKQLIVFGHGGKQMWQSVLQRDSKSEHPINDFSVEQVTDYFNTHHPDLNFEIIYPGSPSIGLQEVGKLAGWHQESPFRVGINETWGTWYAYRVAILADSQFSITPKVNSSNPCTSCESKPCVEACPPRALDNKEFRFERCMGYRKQENSLCADRCIARMVCPVAKEHKYTKQQIQYHYSLSLKTIMKRF